MKNRIVYLDNNATTKVAPEVLQEMLEYYSEKYGNPSSMHNFGGEISKKINENRQKIAGLINADPSEIIITSCGTESDNTAINSALRTQPGKKHIVTSRVEHPAVLSYFKSLESEGYSTTYINVDEKGRIDLNQLENSVTGETALVSIMHANNETGTIFPIKEISEYVKSKDVLFHTDAVQSAGKIEIDVNKIPVDLLSISGHKLHAAKGIGVLYVRKGTKFSPFLIGGHQEQGRRGGTENVASIIGLGKACELAKKNIEFENREVRRLRDKLENGILAKISNVKINGDTENRLPNTTNISFEFIEGEGILLLLNEYGICASSGSACTSGSLEPSHVLRSMGVSYNFAHGSIRFSLSRYNTDEDIDYTLEKLPEVINKLRSISPFYNKK